METLTLQDASDRIRKWMNAHPGEVQAKAAAIDRFGKYFAPDNLKNISDQGVKQFLTYRANRHWMGINRHPIYKDMDRLRNALALLLDQSKPIIDRLDRLINKSDPINIKGLNRAVLTPILMCVYPEEYAVYNNRTTTALSSLGKNPIEHATGMGFGQRYVEITKVCKSISNEIHLPLRLVDTMFAMITPHPEPSGGSTGDPGPVTMEDDETPEDDTSLVFDKEHHLERFILANWDKIVPFKDFELHRDNPEDEDESACQYRTGIGRIDMLARDKDNWVVIELKRSNSADEVIGQVLRYMGWIKCHRARPGETVKGIIVAKGFNEKLSYALPLVSDVSCYTYALSFQVSPHGEAASPTPSA